MSEQYYYDIKEDIENNPDCWCIVVYSGRNTGKTYSALKYMHDGKHPFAFTKRTNDDVDILCAANKKVGSARVDLNPWKAIHRNNPEINVLPIKVQKGIGAFF